MPVIPVQIRGAARIRLLKQHRALIFFKALDAYSDGRKPLEYLLNRYDKLLEIGLPPVRNKTAKKWKE